MESKEVRGLMEAYASVYNQDLNETMMPTPLPSKDPVKMQKPQSEPSVKGPAGRGPLGKPGTKGDRGPVIKSMPDLSTPEDKRTGDRIKNTPLGMRLTSPGGPVRNPGPATGPNGFLNRKESVDLFDYLLEYLVTEGYADTNKAALVIMANMSEDWKQSIIEGVGGYDDPILGPHTPGGKLVRGGVEAAKKVVTGVVKDVGSEFAKPAPQPPGGLTPMQRLQRRPDPTIR